MRTVKLWLYILRAHVAPFIYSTAIVMALFLLQYLMQNIDNLVGKGIGVVVIVQLIVLNLAWMLVLAVPMGVLVAALMAFGNLSSRNEITAMKASGMGAIRMMFPAMFAGLIITYAVFVFDNDILPDANHKARLLFTDIQQKKPTFAIEAGQFSNAINGYSILALKTHENSNLLEGVTIYDYSQPGMLTIVTAQRGTPSFTQDYSKLVFELEDGEIHRLDTRNMAEYRAIRFERHQITMSAAGFQFVRTNDAMQPRGDREMNIATMRAEAARAGIMEAGALRRTQENAIAQWNSLVQHSQQAVGSSATPAQRAAASFSLARSAVESDLAALENARRTENSYLVEIYKKYSIPFACFVFVLIGAPLGIIVRRGTFGVSAGVSLAFFVVYWACLIGGEKLADRNFISPFTGMWIANIALGALGVYLIVHVAREAAAIRLAWLKRFVPKRWRREETEAAGLTAVKDL